MSPQEAPRPIAGVTDPELVRWIFNQPGGYRVAKEAIGKTSVIDRRLYITDGGHYDNTGLVEALRRRPDRIIVLDASNDPPNSFRALGEAVATARMDLGCEVDIDPTPMVADRFGQAKRGWVSGTARCDDGKEIEVHFIKAVPTTSMPLDTQVYASRHPEFPRTSTGNQFYGEFDLEAYRQLGIEATRSWLRSIGSPAADGAALSRGNGAVTGVTLRRTRSPRSAPAR